MALKLKRQLIYVITYKRTTRHLTTNNMVTSYNSAQATPQTNGKILSFSSVQRLSFHINLTLHFLRNVSLSFNPSTKSKTNCFFLRVRLSAKINANIVTPVNLFLNFIIDNSFYVCYLLMTTILKKEDTHHCFVALPCCAKG